MSKVHGLVEFAAQFVLMARKSAREFPNIKKTWFTSRQSLAIASLGTTRIFRTRAELGIPDLVNLAVLTSPPEAQKYAEMIALRILVGDESELIAGAKTGGTADDDGSENALQQAMTGSSELLNDLLEFLGLHQSVDPDKGMAEQQFAELAEDTLFSPDQDKYNGLAQEQRAEMARRRLSFEVASGREGIIRNHLTSWEQLEEHACNRIKQSIPFIDKKSLAASQLLGMTNDIQELSREQNVKDISSLLAQATSTDKEQARANARQLADGLTERQVSKAMETMEEYKSLLNRSGLDVGQAAPSLEEVLDELGQKFKENATTFDEVLEYPGLFAGEIGHDMLDEMLENTWNASKPMDVLMKAKQLDDIFGTNMSSKAFDKHAERYDELDFDEIVSEPIASGEWMDALNHSMDAKDEDVGWNESFRRDQKLHEVSKQLGSPYLSSNLKERVQNSINDMINNASTPEQLEDAVHFARDNGYQVKNQDVKDKGTELNMSREDIARLLGGAFEYLKEIIATEDPSFERVSALMHRAHLTNEQQATLIKESVQHGAAGALGALASNNLLQVARSVPNTPAGAELFEQALGAGGGENLLYQWFMHGKALPPWLRQIAKDAAKRVMIDIAKAKSSALIGSSEAGPLPEGTTRPYVLGDDPDAIDIEESLENILDMGKRIDDLLPDDFIVRKEVTGRRCVVFLVDISGSMNGQPLAAASIACAMLLMAFCRDELGVALFESDTHVICEIDQDIDIDKVVDEILDLEARGGTQMQAALQWAEDQFLLSKSQDKMFVMVTDAMIGDFDRSKEHLRNIADQGGTSMLIVPEVTYSIGNIQSIVESANAHLVIVGDWKKFPEIVSKILSRV